jgi:tetratricopeptide (TPR) repeat protein
MMMVGEPGIGKTRMLEEFAEIARAEHASVLWGRCYEGEWAPPFGPFAEAIAEYARLTEPETIRRELGYGGPPLTRLVPALRERLPDLGEPAPLAPEEERFRLLDAASQFMIAISQRAPLVLVLDDLHWADKGTLAMMRHVARFIGRNRIMMLGAYRDVELDRQHPLADALAAMRREAPYERIPLKGLQVGEIGELLSTIAAHDAPDALVKAISAETEGNPFFIREVLLHLIEEGKVLRQEWKWAPDVAIEDLGIPEGVRQVIGRRLSRLTGEANRLLGVASAFNGAFRFDIAASVASLDEAASLRAIDEALAAQVLRPGVESDSYDFTHALIRHTLYGEMNPSRQVRTHRQIAEAMERIWGERAIEHAAEIAYQYSRSAALPGAERGAAHAIAAADRAEAAYAYDEVVALLKLALELLPAADVRRARLLGRLGLALAWTLNSDEALIAAGEAGDSIAGSEGEHAAADYLADATDAMASAGFMRAAGALASHGLRYAGDRRDDTWARLTIRDLMREEADEPDYPGIPLDSPRRRELHHYLRNKDVVRLAYGVLAIYQFQSREEVLASASDLPWALSFWAGEYRRALPLWEEEAARSEQKGQMALVVQAWAQAARCHNALGDFTAANEAYRKGRTAGSRLTIASPQVLQLLTARDEMWLALDENWERALASYESRAGESFEVNWFRAGFRAARARIYAHLGKAQQALDQLKELIVPLERAEISAPNYTRIACDAVSTLWMLGRTDYVEVIERNIREKVVVPDFRYPMQDWRLSLARLCALQGRYDEAIEWFAKARGALEEQGARPLRAIADFDEAWMCLRRRAAGDRERAKPLLDAAKDQFRSIGMTGWLRRAEGLAPRGN